MAVRCKGMGESKETLANFRNRSRNNSTGLRCSCEGIRRKHSWITRKFFATTSPFKVYMAWKIIATLLFELAFHSTEKICKRYWRFCIMQTRKAMTSWGLQLKIVKYWIKNISENIKAVFFKLASQTKPNDIFIISLPRKLSWPQSCSVKYQISSFSTI